MHAIYGATTLLLTLLLGIAAAWPAKPAASQASASPFEFGLIGDLPYTFEDEAKLPSLIAEMNAANLAFVVHDGDFKTDSRAPATAPSRSGPCTDELFREILALFQTFRDP